MTSTRAILPPAYIDICAQERWDARYALTVSA
jgi:hypothetical protein